MPRKYISLLCHVLYWASLLQTNQNLVESIFGRDVGYSAYSTVILYKVFSVFHILK